MGRSTKTKSPPAGAARVPIVRSVLVAVLVLSAIPLSATQAAACAGDTWADGSTWSDNYWVGYNTAGTTTCDLAGRYVYGVQRINWSQGYQQSGVDGSYGNNTHQDVRSFQAFYGLGVDGLVGSTTWGQYRNRITMYWVDGALDVYRATSAGSGGSGHFALDTVAQRWYVGMGTWQKFDLFGP